MLCDVDVDAMHLCKSLEQNVVCACVKIYILIYHSKLMIVCRVFSGETNPGALDFWIILLTRTKTYYASKIVRASIRS